MKKHSIAIAAALFALIAASAFSFAQKKSGDAALQRNVTTFNAVVKEIADNYVDSLQPDRAFQAAISAFLATVDPYTEYYPREEQEMLQKMTTGEYGGIGAYLMDRDSSTYISAPMEGSPATLAGVLAGDRILQIDTVDVSKKLSADVTKLLRGRPNTQVRVKLQRPYAADSILTVNIMRAKLQQPSVPYFAVIGNTGYIQLTSFINKSPEEVKHALEEFKKDPRVQNIVLDLRGNGGGLVESAVDIVGFFVPKGTEVVRTKGRDASIEKVYKTTHTPIFPDIPLAILIDGGTASASEIVSAAVQDLDRGVLIGSRSFGKGLVQSTRPLPFDGIIKVTVAKYYTPSGRLIQALDYTHRNPDGSAARVPDSLTREYKTLHGRTVRDGGGLQPDSVIDWGKVSRLVYNVVRDNWSFDYATKYVAEHPVAPDMHKFQITDSVYSEFKASIDPAKFKYDKVMDEAMKQLREMATDEGYTDPQTVAAFDTLQNLLKHDLARDLDIHRDEIEEYLGPEILSRYYFDRGKVAYALRTDKALKAAQSILSSPEYRRLLTAQKPTAKK